MTGTYCDSGLTRITGKLKFHCGNIFRLFFRLIFSQEELMAQVQCLTEELFQLQESHQKHLNSLRDQAKKPFRPRAMSDVNLCRQASVRLQRRLSVSIQELESCYEPRLIALLKRKQLGEKALRVGQEQAASFRAQLEPLKQEAQRLEEQKSCLEQRINLMQQEREEMITHHKVQCINN